MRQIFGGAALTVAGIAAFIEAHTHRPIPREHVELPNLGGGLVSPPSQLSTTAYDLLRIGAWALVILGVLLILTGLIRFWATQIRR